MRWTGALVAIITARLAHAHVAPSVDDNNRYVKLGVQGDRVRLAYTVFFGEVPGKTLRKSLDRDANGTISDDESHAYGTRVATDVAAALELSIDQQRQPVVWTQVSVGMGTPAVTCGAFSVDMVAYVCLAKPVGRHALHLRDRFRVPKPGETELRIEDGAGITIDSAAIASAQAHEGELKLVGPTTDLAEHGLRVAFTIGDRAASSGACVAPGDDAPPWGWIAGGVATLGLAAGYAFARNFRK